MHWRNRRRVRRRTSGRSFVYNLRFPGQYFDAETGLNYNDQRDYDPATGRYVESDPIGLAGGSYSTYSYAGSDSLRFIDPLGLAASCGVPDRCAQLRQQIFKKSALLIRELRKYNPIEDARGGFLTGGGLYTVPGGHYTKIQNLQRGLKNDIADYKRLCSDNGGWPPVPRSLDEAANRDVPVPIITPEPDIELPGNNPSLVAPSGGLLEILEMIGALAL
jgi:RHS repeat-associated protein